MSKPVEVEFLMKDNLTPGMNKAEREALELRNTVRLLEAELERLRLAGETAAPNLDQSANIAQIHALEKQLEELRSQLKFLQEESESVQVTPADVPNAQRQFNGLHNSIQQMAREMPSLAMGPQMFFMAISNNLPIFTDELARARKEYDELQKSGKKGTPVWKQVLSSLFSWQTAMTTGIMLLVMYGDEIWDWTKNLFSAKKGVDEFNISLKEMTEIEKDGRAQMVRTRFELKSVIDEIKNFTGSKEQEKAKVEELNRKYGESFGYYKTLSEWYDAIIQKSEDYVQSLYLQAKVQNLVKKASEVDEKIAEAEAKDESEFDTWWGYGGKVDRFFSSDQSYKQNNNGRWKKKEEIDRLTAEYNGYILEAENLTKERLKLEQESGIGGHIDPKKTETDPEAEAKQRLATERRLAKDLAVLQAENRKEEIDRMQAGTEKKLAQIEYDYKARKEEINRQEADWKRENKEAGISTGGNGLTPEQTDALAAARDSNDKNRSAALAATFEEEKEKEAEAMRDYLSEYGNYEEKKLAITQEYEKRIAEAATEGEQKTLQEELKKKMADLDMEELKEGLDWESVFGDLDKVSTESLQSLRTRLKEYIDTQKDLKPDSLKDLVRAIDSIDKKLNERNPFTALKTSISQVQSTTLSVKEAQEAYNKAVREGTEAEQQNAKATLDAARNAKQKALAEATDSLHNSVGQVKEYVGAAEDLLGLVEQFGIDPPEWMGEWLDGMGQTLDGLESIDLTRPMSILTGGIKALDGVVKQVFSLGGIINWSGSNAKEVQATMERLTNRNELLQTSIEDLTDTLKQSRGTKSVAAYRDAYKMQQETNSNYLQMAMAQAGYHGSHHSWNYYWGGFSQAQIDKLSGQIGRQWDGNLWSLSPEEMKALRSNVDMWTQIQNTGKGGYGGRLTEKLDDYIAQAGKLEELTDQLYEGLTGISFDGMYSSFIDNLMNMKYGAKDAAEDISEYFMRAMLSNKIGELYSEKLKGWWEKFGKAMEDNELTEAERNALTEEYMQYVDEALALRDNLAAATGYDKTEAGGTSQSAKAGGFTAMTQDQGTKLEGMFTSGLQHWSSIDKQLESVVEKMDTAEGHLARIAENTGVSAGHLGELKEVIKKMIRDGLKVK
ncbi:coiled-coil domain-containing protein [Bacteroides uniformis]|uniref:viral A-type inclusion protein n=1 Tax=Bacteroides uniformis TaxID=820 RepID=UPI00125E7E4A|nr:viral A-type inclusion protein [Bacteroides uniformis]KAB3877896.1 viral A-type inclusion protein [Bacteroides uniformis]KAB3898652.1 viral A-type inclusion protein [Bacteroides uniformis]KAB3901043.1 viral A-type inclusion protein [Bacteroides uniformis]KAB3901870.1 viral A-type inclusion protein [Bacteroides uniformis]KAB3910800.1 viral A-type inclusion protein [Bacteroides uniformis]